MRWSALNKTWSFWEGQLIIFSGLTMELEGYPGPVSVARSGMVIKLFRLMSNPNLSTVVFKKTDKLGIEC